MINRSMTASACALVLLLSACSKSTTNSSAPAPAKVATPVVESQLNTITLTPEAVQRLGVEVTAVTTKSAVRTRWLSGEVIAPIGQALIVAAPSAGIVLLDSAVQPGGSVKQGGTVLKLLPFSGSVDISDNQLRVKQAEYEAAANRLSRAEKLLLAQGSSQEEVETLRTTALQTKAALDLLQAQRDAAQGKFANLQNSIAPMLVTSPVGGIVQSLQVANGQLVVSGQSLFEVQGQQAVWVKVPVFSGELAKINTTAAVQVTTLGSEGSTMQAVPVQGPRTAAVEIASLDLYYRITTGIDALRIGEKVRIAAPFKGASDAMVVPESAIYRDMYGGSHVYERTGDNVFVRRRVDLRDIINGNAIIARGIARDAQVVTVGVAELAGAEFGIAK